MRLFGTIVFISAVQQANGLSDKVLHALPEFVTGDVLAALRNSILNQFNEDAFQQRCLPTSCVLPQTKVSGAVGERLRQALALAASGQSIDMNRSSVANFLAKDVGDVHLPALRTELDGQSDAHFHDDFDVDEPQKEAVWTALLYLDASIGDRFMVRFRETPEHVESHEIKPGTLILFKSSEVEHTATGTAQESRRLALGPVALDKTRQDPMEKASANQFRPRILGWGSSGGGGGSKEDAAQRVFGSHHLVWIAGAVMAVLPN